MSSEVKELEKRKVQRSSEYRDYSPELKASVIQYLSNNGGIVLAAAKVFNIAHQTVDYWWKQSERYSEFQKPSSENLAEKLSKIAHRTADSLMEHDLSIVGARDKAAIIQSTVQTRNLLLGLPTNVNETIQHTEVSILLQDALSTCLDVTPAQPADTTTSCDPPSTQDQPDYVESPNTLPINDIPE